MPKRPARECVFFAHVSAEKQRNSAPCGSTLQPHRQVAQVEGAEPSSRVATRETLPRPFSFCQAFSFGPTWAKEKAEVTSFAFYAAG